MKTVRPWVKALGIPESDYQRWCSSVPTEESVTFHCLREGRIPVDGYLEWARDHYGLAILRSEFFLKPPNTALFDKLKTVSNWSREFVPVHEWDGVIFVACVEPTDVEWSYPVRQVLATPADLEKYWNGIHANHASNDAIPDITFETDVTNAFPPAPTIPIPPRDELTKTPVANLSKKEADPFEALSAIIKTPVVTNAIEGIELKIVVPDIDLNIPEGFTSSAVATKSQPSEPSMEALMAELTKTASQGETSTPEVPESTFTAIRPSTGVPAPEKSSQFGVGQFESEATLNELAADFEGSMVLKIENERLQPWAWDSHWVSSKPVAIDLSGPSAFRVVYRTKMPYMGHIVDTPANTAFFTGWGFSALPEAVLVQPLFHQGNWIGMLVLKCDKNKKQSQLLMIAERVAPKFVDLMTKVQLKAA